MLMMDHKSSSLGERTTLDDWENFETAKGVETHEEKTD